jgi:IS5 family transposase
LLLASWHELSDVTLAEALDERASFRRFCGFAAHEPTPERTAFVRFRRELVRGGLDATLIPSASIRHDGGPTHASDRWAGHRRRKPTHGDTAQVATDEAAGLVCGVEVTTANVHDAAELEAVLPSQPGDVYGGDRRSAAGHSAFAGRSTEAVIRARGGPPQVVHTGTWGRPEALVRRKAHNAAVRRVRCRIETVFGTWKRSYGLRRMRWIGLAKAGLQVRLAAIACTLRRTATLISAAA